MQPRYYQDEAVQALFDYFARARGNPLVALPTATGKSVVIALFCYRALNWYPQTRILMLTHVKELISQNYHKLVEAWPRAPAGVYSAGLGRKDIFKQITFGGIQSVANNVEAFGHIDLVGIDEAHLVGPEEESRYQQVIAQLKQVNPHLKVFGLTATWWRKKQGALTNDGLFTEICYNKTKPEDFKRFIAEGYLSPLVTKKTNTHFDLSGVGMIGGEYNLKQLEAAVDQETVTHAALREICEHGQDRRAWLLFCSGISHAEHCAQILTNWGIRTGVVHSKISKHERDQVLQDWYAGKLRAVTNNNVLTTGIDYPAIDLIAALRPTQSSLLHVQMLGRGMRPSLPTGKVNCLCLDFAGNTARCGPVDDPNIPGRPRPNGTHDAPVKICDVCNAYNHASARFCDVCASEFPTVEKLSSSASTHDVMTADIPVIETFDVTNVLYANHLSKANNHSIKVTYFAGIRAFYEYIQIGATGYQGHKASMWWKQRHYIDPPETVEDALRFTSELRVPTRIRVWVNKQYPEVLSHEWH